MPSNSPESSKLEQDNTIRNIVAAICGEAYTQGASRSGDDNVNPCWVKELYAYTASRERAAQIDGASKFIEETWGERCDTTDKEDFPDTDYDNPKNHRCSSCEMWEYYDEWLKAKSKVRDGLERPEV